MTASLTCRSLAGLVLALGLGNASAEVPPLADLGKKIFFDTSLSQPAGQGCVSCHQPDHAFADPRPVSPGAVEGKKGRRNAPSLMYAALIPPLTLEDIYDENGEESFIIEGGYFLDGRSHLLIDQVKQPFFDSNEMNLPDEAALADRLRNAPYANTIKNSLGEPDSKDDTKVTALAYRALVAFLREPHFRPFNAPIDAFWAGNKNALTDAQKRGLDIFQTGAQCSKCHLTGSGAWLEPLLSDYGYDNLGAPSLGQKDPGLGAVTGKPDELGQFKVPSLRNVALTAPYLHNGSIATLREVMEFYNKRNLEKDRWGPTDYPDTVNHDDMGDLGLSDQEIDDLVALMHAFTDQALLDMKPGQELPDAPAGTPSTASRKAFFRTPVIRIDPKGPRSRTE
ncbi:MAG: cytochrome-c peroxidase [Verrucomicrobiaceae bacterium]